MMINACLGLCWDDEDYPAFRVTYRIRLASRIMGFCHLLRGGSPNSGAAAELRVGSIDDYAEATGQSPMSSIHHDSDKLKSNPASRLELGRPAPDHGTYLLSIFSLVKSYASFPAIVPAPYAAPLPTSLL